MVCSTRTWCLLAVTGIFVGCSGGDDKGKQPPPDKPGFTIPRLELDNVENTRAWAEQAVTRLKALEANGDRSATDAEVAKIEKELHAALQDKEVRWSLVISGVRQDGEVDLEQFYGAGDGKVQGGGDAGKPRRKLYFRIYLDADGDEVRVGDEIGQPEASKGNRFTLRRKVIETNIRQRDTNWSSPNRWTGVVDVLDTFCMDVIVKR